MHTATDTHAGILDSIRSQKCFTGYKNQVPLRSIQHQASLQHAHVSSMLGVNETHNHLLTCALRLLTGYKHRDAEMLWRLCSVLSRQRLAQSTPVPVQ